MKVVINKQHGGFSISIAAAKMMAKNGCEIAKKELEEYNEIREALLHYKKTGKLSEKYEGQRGMFDISIKYNSDNQWYGYGYVGDGASGYPRDSVYLVQAVEALGDKANGSCASLKVIEIPDGTEYTIEEYDGLEWVAEKHETWG